VYKGEKRRGVESEEACSGLERPSPWRNGEKRKKDSE